MGKEQIKIKEYKNAKDFDKDAQKMVKDGWELRDQSQNSGHMNVGRTLFTTIATGGLNMLDCSARSAAGVCRSRPS